MLSPLKGKVPDPFLGSADSVVSKPSIPGMRRDGEGEKDPYSYGGSGMLEREVTLKGTLDMAREICEGGPVATIAAMRAVMAETPRSQRGFWEEEMYEVVKGTRDRDEALRAFREKRGVGFIGR